MDGGVTAQVDPGARGTSRRCWRAKEAALDDVVKTTVFLTDMADFVHDERGLSRCIRRPSAGAERLRRSRPSSRRARRDRGLGVHAGTARHLGRLTVRLPRRVLGVASVCLLGIIAGCSSAATTSTTTTAAGPTTTLPPLPPPLYAYVTTVGTGASIGLGHSVVAINISPEGGGSRARIGVGTYPRRDRRHAERHGGPTSPTTRPTRSRRSTS